MSFSRSDLDSIETAILAFAAGETVVSVKIAGKEWTYSAESDRLENLLTLRSLIERELGITPSTLHLKHYRRSRS